MITYLRLQNFRRHVETELRFEATDQVVIVAGNNGVGKTTIFEAVLFALYGEGRNGRGNIERLVRRGGELEGMQVELEFTLADAVYRVSRRRDNQLTSAVLWTNDVAQVEGPREVTAEVSAILGMDARGFKVATYAQQKELNGLASMRPAERGQMLSRLLRLDVVARAKENARGEFRRQRDVLREIGSGEDLAALNEQARQICEQLAANEQALADARSSVVAIDAELAASSALEAAYSAAVENHMRIAALVAAAENDVARLTSELASIVIPDAIEAPSLSLLDLQARSGEIERLIARGEEQQRQHAQISAVRGELGRCETRLDAIDALVALPEADGVDKCENRLRGAQEALRAATERRELLREQYAASQERIAAAGRSLERVSALEAECLNCGQAVPEDHRHDQMAAAEAELAAAEAAGNALLRAGIDAKEQLGLAQSDLDAATVALDAAQRRRDERDRATNERTELLRRRAVYLDQLERLDGTKVDLSALYAERAELAVAVNLATQAHERAVVRASRLERHAGVSAAIDAASSRLRGHVELLERSAVEADLQLAHERRAGQLDARSAEQEVVGELQATVAAWRERSAAVASEIARVERANTRRSDIERQAQVSWWTSEVLDEVETLSAQQIRPSLEGGVGELLARLSDGRFDSVALDDDYNISVRDDGVMRPLHDLSGGEIDLVSLAMRLALSSVVAERQGSGGAGFLILDEPIGSQDPSRRGSILNALRSLKASHGQIFLISHVGGLEDAADSVVEVDLDDERHAVASKQ
jgi:DNA repair protein SbcC/Rad50